jgi:hypothetical protein
VNDSDLSTARNAAAEWTKAADALTQFIAGHPHPYRDNPPSLRRAYMSYRSWGYGPIWSVWRACCYLCGRQSSASVKTVRASSVPESARSLDPS